MKLLRWMWRDMAIGAFLDIGLLVACVVALALNDPRVALVCLMCTFLPRRWVWDTLWHRDIRYMEKEGLHPVAKGRE